MKNTGIKSRVLLLAILPAMIIAVLLTGYSISQSLRELDQELRERGRIIAVQLAAASEYGVISGNQLVLQNLVQQAMMQEEDDIRAVLVTDGTGRTLAVSGKPILKDTIARHSHAIQPNEWAVNGEAMFSAPVVRSTIEIDDYAPSPAPLADNGGDASKVIGQVYVVVSKTPLTQIKNTLVMYNLLIAAAGLLISGLLGWRLGRSITRPIGVLADAVRRVASGDLDLRVPENSGGELGTLEHGFNNMAIRLQIAHSEMQDRIDDATQQLRYQAHHDALTGLVNRREFEKRLERALQNAREHGVQHAFCYMDLDQFKIVNDTCGHGAGDELLQQISLLLSSRLRDRDTLARLGGDEFGLLLENCVVDDAWQIAEELRELVRDFRYVFQDKIFNIGVSIGIVAITHDTPSVESVMNAADSACYAAKDNGRNLVHIFQEGDADLSRRQGEMQWISRIARAMEEDRFLLYCQPILPLLPHLDEMRHFEILLRKVSETGKIIPPMAFIPAAERFHKMNAIDRWVISNVFSTLRHLIDRKNDGLRCAFSINLSGMSLGDKSLLPFITDQFAQHGIPPQCICFEITETAAIINLSSTVELINTLRAMGCRFLLDDFGSGMSSFAYLKNLPVDFVKIDGTFVKDMASNPVDYTMVQSIHSIAAAMQIKTIAEFVESATVVEMLQSIGVHYGQGYHLGKPAPIAQALSGLVDGSSPSISKA